MVEKGLFGVKDATPVIATEADLAAMGKVLGIAAAFVHVSVAGRWGAFHLRFQAGADGIDAAPG